jgi:peptide deformylase
MALLKLIIAPDPILKQMSVPVSQVDSEIRSLMDDMLETMYHENGAGLAAVQVGVLKRVLVIDIEGNEIQRKPYFMANPEIINFSAECSIKNEGCLSFPSQRIQVSRPTRVKVKFLDYHNTPQELEADDWFATAIQHEIDHLNGIVFADYSSKLKRDLVMSKALKIKKLSI